ncbi:MAG: SdpI family protein, partial [Candidatus Aenigmarchaeota archaeon]|nr:SdpI family protein [Candidatus Aenigmarchaeota archaeon]
IRTPWTLSSERVWNETHRAAAKLFKAAGLITFAGILAPQYAIYFVLVPILAIVVFSFVYSYTRYVREEKRKRKH